MFRQRGLVSIDFDLAGNPEGGQTVKDLQVQLGPGGGSRFHIRTLRDIVPAAWDGHRKRLFLTSRHQATLFCPLPAWTHIPSDWGTALAITVNRE